MIVSADNIYLQYVQLSAVAQKSVERQFPKFVDLDSKKAMAPAPSAVFAVKLQVFNVGIIEPYWQDVDDVVGKFVSTSA